ncbi:unnamed protein product [Pylaiella littoralis]
MAGGGTDDDETLGAWALRYRGVATFGALALLLGIGKFVGFHWYRLVVLRRAVVPPAVISGLLGCVVYRLFKGVMSPGVKSSLDESLSEVVVLMINFTFSALTLGFASAGTYVPRTRAVLASIWHEALPMLVYSQVLIWGQSCVALLTVGLIRLGNPDVSIFLGALITMGLETGRDVMSFSTREIAGDWADEVVRLADSMGLLLSIFGGICLMTFHMGGLGQPGARGYALVGNGENAAGAADGLMDVGGGDRDAGRQREHFARGRGKCGWLVGRVSPDRGGFQGIGGAPNTGRGPSGGATTGLDDDDDSPGSLGNGNSNNNHRSRSHSPRSRPPVRGAGMAAGSLEAGAAEAGVARRDRGPTLGMHRAGLGAHLLLPAVSVGAAWLLDLFIRAVENHVEWTAKHHIISGFRLFQLSMCAALLFMCIIRRTSPFRYHSEWFFRLSGLCLDLMTTAAISSIGFASIPDKFNAAFLLVLLSCVVWNVGVFVVLAPRMFPNFWLLRATALIGDALGHSWVGLLLLRAMDFRLQTPVPLAYVYKTMMFFVPASGSKNAIVVAMVDVMGVWEAFLVCLVVCAAWLWVFDWHFKAKMPHNQQKKEEQRSKKKEERSPLRTRKKVTEDVELVDMHKPGLGIVEVESAVEDAREVVLDQPSKILTASRLRRLAEAVPLGQAMKTWRLGYSIARDGASLWTLLQNCRGRGPCLIVVEDSWGYVFGGFVAGSIKESQDYYGTGESFVYSFHPTFKAHRWTGANDYFCISSDSWLAMGGGGGGFAFQIDDELDAGESNPSDTFGNPRLSSNEFFRCLQVEVWYFSDLKPPGS